jgi:iron complex outermembrane recepter protein
MAPHRLIPFTLLALASAAQAQSAPERIVVTGRAAPQVAGFGTAPLAQSPFQASVIGADVLAEAGGDSLAAVTRLDAGVSDAYNAEGYWSALTVRGFVLDLRANYRRDGLPINAETAILLANKDRIEVLKGTSGVQAGISAPGGLVNLVVKRPAARVRDARLEAQQGGTLIAAVDLAERFGEGHRFGLRVNALAADLAPTTRNATGSRRLLALAGDWQLSPDGRLEAEFETSRQRQPSVPAFSLRGDVLPDAGGVDPRLNLNNQPWSLPVVLEGNTLSLRWRQRLASDWQFTVHGASQQLRSADRVAFPFGCYDAVADRYYADRYCPDGSFDLYDFRSEGERRRTDALDLQWAGSVRTGGVTHDLAAGVLLTRREDRFQGQAFNYAGPGRDDGTAVTPAAPDLTDANTNRDERSTEFYLRDAMQLAPAWSLWAGLRHTRLARASLRTDDTQPTSYRQSFVTPWLGLGWRPVTTTLVYASWGQGVETEVAPNRARYVNAGQALPAIKSRQWEAGVKLARNGLEAGAALFDIVRPLAVDVGDCDVDGSCERRIDGDQRHRGVELNLAQRWRRWAVQGGAMFLEARREQAAAAADNGLAPVNVPRRALKARLSHDLAAVPGLQLQAALVHEGPRQVLPDNSLQAPAWTRLDLGVRWMMRHSNVDWTLRAAIDNVANERAWRETPQQFGHVWLFPLAPRTWRVSLSAAV